MNIKIDTAWLRPASGLLVRHEDPSRGMVPEDGAEVPMTKYYRRRVADGDLVRGRRPKPPSSDAGSGKGAK